MSAFPEFRKNEDQAVLGKSAVTNFCLREYNEAKLD